MNTLIVTSPQELGREIRRRRKELQYTQAFLSEFSGLSVSFISDIERGKTTAEIGKILHLVNLLGMDLEICVRGR